MNPSADAFRRWLPAVMTALLVARPLYPSESAAVQGDGLPVVMLWLALAVFWLIGTLRFRRTEIRLGPVDVAAAAFFAWMVISAIHAACYGNQRPALNMLWEWIGLATVYFLARQLTSRRGEVRAVVAAMVAVAAAISAYGIYQGAVELPSLQKQYAANPEAMLREAGLNYPPGAPIREQFERRLANCEPLGTFALTNSLAAVLAPWLVVGIGAAAAGWRNRRLVMAWVAVLAPIAVCLALAKSRSGYVAVAAGVFFLVGQRLRFRRRWLLAAACALAVSTVLLVAFRSQPPVARALQSFGYRMQYWQATWPMIALRPWLGCGPGNYQDVYTQFKLPEASENIADPHNFLIEVWATGGTPALLALLAVLGLCLARRGPRGEVRDSEPDASDWRPIFPGAIGGFVLSLAVGQISSAPPSLLSFAIGLPAAAASLLFLLPWVRGGRLPPGLPALGAAVLLVDLLTTGGISYPGIAQTLWLLLALELAPGQAEVRPDPNRTKGGLWATGCLAVPRPAMIALLALEALLALGCYFTSYSRVLPCQNLQRLARLEHLEGRLPAARELLERAVAADPRSSDAHGFLAQVCFEQWLASQDKADYEAFRAYDALARHLAPESAAAWRASAAFHYAAATKVDDQGRSIRPDAIGQAIESARRAVQLNPGSSFDYAMLALTCRAVGDEAGCRSGAAAAMELDRRMTHEDKKLPAGLRQQLETILGESGRK